MRFGLLAFKKLSSSVIDEKVRIGEVSGSGLFTGDEPGVGVTPGACVLVGETLGDVPGEIPGVVCAEGFGVPFGVPVGEILWKGNGEFELVP